MNAARATLILGLALLAAPAVAQERIDFGPFYYLTDEPDRLYLDGVIDDGSADWFWRAINTSADISKLVLNGADWTSGEDALVIADIVRFERFDTLVPAQSICDFACTVIYLAGVGRTLEGQLRFAIGGAPPVDATLALMDSEMARYGLPQTVTTRILANPRRIEPILSIAEMAALQRTHEQGMQDIADDVEPRPTLTVDVDPATEPIFFGEPQIATIREFDTRETEGLTTAVEGLVGWFAIIDPPSPPSLGAVIAFGEPMLVLQIFINPIVDSRRPYISHAVIVREFDQVVPDREVVHVENITLGLLVAGTTDPMVLLTGPGDDIRQAFLLPRVVAGLELERLAHAQQLSFVIAYSQYDGAVITLNKGPDEEAGILSVLREWGLLRPGE